MEPLPDFDQKLQLPDKMECLSHESLQTGGLGSISNRINNRLNNKFCNKLLNLQNNKIYSLYLIFLQKSSISKSDKSQRIIYHIIFIKHLHLKYEIFHKNYSSI